MDNTRDVELGRSEGAFGSWFSALFDWIEVILVEELGFKCEVSTISVGLADC